ncbi:MAG: protein phosphatase 2C domain-containing protein [Chloroflexota bacterium]
MIIQQYNQASIEHLERCEDSIVVFNGDGGFAPVFAVIDGMGGHQHQDADGKMVTGREASQLVRTVLIEDLQHLPVDAEASPDGAIETKVIDAVHRAHHELLQELNHSDTLPAHKRVGAVLTVVVVCENGKRLLVIQVGDTRAYLFSEDELIQLCADEDNIEYLEQQHIISPEDGAKIGDILNTFDGVNEPEVEGTITINGQPFELYLAWRWFLVGNSALNIPGANIVLNAVGVYPENPVPQTSRIEISEGDMLLIVSDGIYKNLTDAEMTGGLKSEDDAAVELGNAAFTRSQDQNNRRRTPDDISAIVVKF